jgi:hypothetical protein
MGKGKHIILVRSAVTDGKVGIPTRFAEKVAQIYSAEPPKQSKFEKKKQANI